jgi:hypothetical protein
MSQEERQAPWAHGSSAGPDHERQVTAVTMRSWSGSVLQDCGRGRLVAAKRSAKEDGPGLPAHRRTCLQRPSGVAMRYAGQDGRGYGRGS